LRTFATCNALSSLKEKEEKYWLVLETPAERKSRLISLYIVHSAMLVFSLGFSIVLTGIVPY
jgi:hypothetical protein